MKKKSKYIFSKGTLKRKDNTIFFFNEQEKKTIIPVETIKDFYFFDEVTINTKLMSYLSSKNIDMHFFNHYQSYVGSFYSSKNNNNFYLRKKQMETYEKRRLEIAKKIVLGIKNSMDYTMNHYYKHNHTAQIKNLFFEETKELTTRHLDAAKTINQILMIEGRLWKSFYKMISEILNNEFTFEKRIKRLPNNEINAMISYGNAILYGKVASQLRRTQIDLGVSFLHEITDKRESLVLDIADIFKPIIVINVILKLVNKKMIKREDHFLREFNYCLLNEEGKKILIKEMDERLNKTIMHKKLKRKISLETCIKIEAYKLIKDFIGEEKYVPFHMREGI